ncbi:MAG: hypothetical protein KF893_07840 [Caldilineaceae bacterium]|nr:hypothetical protein [Caldilineaceae bacterium]
MFTTALPMVKSILIQEPICLLWLVGLIMAWIQRREYPKVSGLAAAALLLFLVQTTVGIYLDMWMPVILYEHMQRLPAWLFGLLTFNEPAQLIIRTVAWSLLLFALFNWRSAVYERALL